MERKFSALALAAALVASNAAGALAQDQIRRAAVPAQTQDVEEFFIAQGPGVAPPPPPAEVRGDNVIFLATEMSFAGKFVKGAPYSAQAVTETVQQLADGNRIVRRNTAQVYRDGEGRTRREQTLGHIGPYVAPQGEAPQTVFINDPVGGFQYILDPAKRTARKLPRVELRVLSEDAAKGTAEFEARRKAAADDMRRVEVERSLARVPSAEAPPAQSTVIVTSEGEGGPFIRHSSKHEAKTEKLEARSFDGVMAEGTRTTTTIPAGEIGNEQPIQIVDERWYSPELQVVVMTRHSDPRSGERTYRLTNISRAEPSAALFQVPSDYTVRDNTTPPPGVRRAIRRMAPPPPQQDLQ